MCIRDRVSAAPVVDSLELSGSAQVNLDVLISEVSSNITREFGIDWSVRSNPFTSLDPFSNPLHSPINGTRLATGALELVRQTVNIVDLESGAEVLSYEDLDVGATPRLAEGGIVLSHSKVVNSGEYQATAFLEAMAENGLLVVHARPTLTAVSGQPAEFFSGLEIPLPVVAERGTVGTQYSEVGVGLSFTPTVLDSGQISLLVEPRIREVVNGGANIAGAFVPNINERSASTRVELGDGESIAIAGLYRRISNSGESGIPMLKDIPLWGALFRSSRQREESVELIIVVTPRIVSGVPPALLAARSQPAQSARQLANEFHY